MKQTKMLPHKWQTYGMYLFVCFALLSLFLDMNHTGRLVWRPDEPFYDYRTTLQMFIERFLIPLSGVLMAFSREEREDEWISSIRYRSLVLAVIIWIFLGVLKQLFVLLIAYRQDLINPYFAVIRYYEVGMFPILYMVCLKASLWIESRKFSKSDAMESHTMPLRKPQMLPYYWYYIGVIVGGWCILMGIVSELPLLMFNSGQHLGSIGNRLLDNRSAIMAIYWLVAPVALTAAAFSSERIEDERIAAVRKTALPKAVILFFIVYFVMYIVRMIATHTIDMSHVGGYGKYQAICTLSAHLTGWSAFMVYYLCFFKISLNKENKSLDNEE